MLPADPFERSLVAAAAARVGAARARASLHIDDGASAVLSEVSKREPLRLRPLIFHDAPDGVAVDDETPVWSWWLEASDPGCVQDLTCKVPAVEPVAHELTVCTTLRWSSVTASWQGRRYELPLETAYVTARAHVHDGLVPPRDDAPPGTPPWRLDGSLVVALGHALGADGGVRPLSAARADDCRVRVLLELACSRSRADVDPSGWTRGAPFLPRLTLHADQTLDGASAEVRVERPPQTLMVGCDADIELAFRSNAEEPVRAAAFSLSNDPAAPGPRSLPTWDRVFDRAALLAQDRAHPFTAIRSPAAEPPFGAPPALRRALDPSQVARWDQPVPSAAWVLTHHAEVRTSRQGDVDGVCLAPPLRAPASVDSALPGWRVRDVVQPLGWGHDALTVCWRAPAGGRADAFPWADVPAGQAVDVLVQGSTLRWLGTQAGPIAPGDSATFFSHGALFGQAVTRAADSASRELLVHPVFPAHIDVTEDAPWLLPWLLRFCAAPAQGPSERLYRP